MKDLPLSGAQTFFKGTTLGVGHKKRQRSEVASGITFNFIL